MFRVRGAASDTNAEADAEVRRLCSVAIKRNRERETIEDILIDATTV